MTAGELERLADEWALEASGEGKYAVDHVERAALMVAASCAWERAAYLRGERPFQAARPDPVATALDRSDGLEAWAERRKQWTEEADEQDDDEEEEK
jgi:hypothetical protein